MAAGVAVLLLLCAAAMAYQSNGVRRASFWPLLPTSHTQGIVPLIVNPDTFNMVDISGQANSTIPEAIAIYRHLIFPSHTVIKGAKNFRKLDGFQTLDRLEVWALDPVARPPQPEEDESFTLSLPVNAGPSTGRLQASTYIGVLRGLETLSQLLIFGVINGTDSSPVFHVPNAPWSIHDQPRFPHRGILVDPSRTFLPIPTLKRVVDGLLASKMNVLHLHLSDAQSFPLQLVSYPNITFYGAYSEDEVYSHSDIADLISYATLRGVRVIPEIESSSHSRTFGLAPELQHIVACADADGADWGDYCAEPPCGQLNPGNKDTIPVVSAVLTEVGQLFPDVNMHLGFDEINQKCWLDDPQFQEYIHDNNYTVGQALQQYFLQMRQGLAQTLPGKQFVYWEEAALQNPALPLGPTDTLQVWNDLSALQRVFNSTPSKVIISWYQSVYLDCGLTNIFGNAAWCQPFNTWLSIFMKDPLANVTDPTYITRVVGGESCMWGEVQGPSSLDTTVWPRAAAYGARLWNYDVSDYSSRDIVLAMSDHVQRLIARGINASPVTVPLCSIDPDYCF